MGYWRKKRVLPNTAVSIGMDFNFGIPEKKEDGEDLRQSYLNDKSSNVNSRELASYLMMMRSLHVVKKSKVAGKICDLILRQMNSRGGLARGQVVQILQGQMPEEQTITLGSQKFNLTSLPDQTSD